jgi:hypothetical protein
MKRVIRKTGQRVRPSVREDVVPTERAWSHREFTLAVDHAKRVGPEGLSDSELIHMCRSAHNYLSKFWADAEPFFVELWRRIEEGSIPHVRTKTEACRLIGCSLRWAEMIVAGTAKGNNRRKADRAKTEFEGTSQTFEPRTNQVYVSDVTGYAEGELKPLLAAGEWSRYSHICKLLAKQFADARKVIHIVDMNRRGRSPENGGQVK